MARRRIIAGNWKMNMTPSEAPCRSRDSHYYCICNSFYADTFKNDYSV